VVGVVFRVEAESLVLRLYVRFLTDTPAILTEVFRGYFVKQTDRRIVPLLDHNLFPLNPLQFIINFSS
jgi:hypothetical protein